MSAQQLTLSLATPTAHSPPAGRFTHCTQSAREVAIALCERNDGVTMDELRAECIALGIKPSPNNWWGTVLRQRFVQTHKFRDHANIWRLA